MTNPLKNDAMMKDLKSGAIWVAWIGLLVLAGWLLWFFTAPLRDAGLLRRINRILAARNESFVLAEAKGWPGRGLSRQLPLGSAFTLEYHDADAPAEPAAEQDFLVFPLLSGGTSISCGFLINDQGRVERVIPLGTHSEQAFERLPQGILDMYIRRIEEGAK
jgi:hypothetical protein